MTQNLQNKGIVLFDGYCNLCSGSVKFILKRDNKDYFRFSSLQSKRGKQFILQNNLTTENNSVILIESNQVYDKSTAALRIARKLKGLWVLFYFFIIIPAPIRDFVYMFIARNRLKWFGKAMVCYTPDKEFKYKFLKQDLPFN